MIKIDEDEPVGEVEASFPYRDVKIRRGVDVKEFYDLQTEIGRGKFGTVYKCREKATGLQLAAKFVITSRKEDRRNVEREIEIMRNLKHPRLIQLYDAFEKDKSMVVVLELIEGGELFERVIDDDFVLTEKSCTVFMRQICEGMEFIHKQNILHLDMKPENILCLTRSGNRIKIIDFGLARKYDPDKKLQVLFGTPEFVAPEVVNFDRIGFGTDMWSIGVICYVLLSGLSPFMGDTDIETMANVTIAKWDFDDEAFLEISDDAKDFISNLLIKEKERRLTAAQCLTHPWLRRKPTSTTTATGTSASKATKPRQSELDVAKDNLKYFVERWNEHPNSPYVFDVNCHTISPCLSVGDIHHLRASSPSMNGCSPSPCASLSSLSDPDDIDSPPISPRTKFINRFQHFENNSPIPSPKSNQLDVLQSFERRASDSSCLIRQNDVVSRINLAEEIKKLSDKLFKMANFQTSQTETQKEQILEIHKPKMIQQRLETSTSNYQSYSTHSQFYETTAKCLSVDSGTAPIRRKIKISNLNRDVPIVVKHSSPCWSRNSSGTLSSCSSSQSAPQSPCQSPQPQADLTHNLLQLLNRYDDTSPKNKETFHRKSISVDWSEDEKLEQRSISSITNYLQSSRNNVEKIRTTFN